MASRPACSPESTCSPARGTIELSGPCRAGWPRVCGAVPPRRRGVTGHQDAPVVAALATEGHHPSSPSSKAEEYATTLDWLGLSDLSFPQSRSRIAAIGTLRPSTTQDGDKTTTPVLGLEGIVCTIITLGCYSGCWHFQWTKSSSQVLSARLSKTGAFTRPSGSYSISSNATVYVDQDLMSLRLRVL